MKAHEIVLHEIWLCGATERITAVWGDPQLEGRIQVFASHHFIIQNERSWSANDLRNSHQNSAYKPNSILCSTTVK